MKKNIKVEILAVARSLFNEYGYNEVSMRTIADVLNISVGNLTYHFKKKEELVEAVVVEFHKNYKKRLPSSSISGLNDFFIRMLSNHNENEYYFRHYTQLAQTCPKVYEIQLSVMKDMYELLLETFQMLQEKGLMKQEELLNQYSYTIQAIIMISTHGKSNFVIEEQEINRLHYFWAIIFPLLTEKGKEQYIQILK